METERPIETLTADDIADNVALARAVGWRDVESDWRVIHEAALVLGVRHQGALIAQGALGVYERAGTIAKMIVAPAFQRQGLAGRLLDALLAHADRRALSVLGLVATSEGRPLYERRQFKAVGDVVVFTGTPRSTARARHVVPLTDLTSVEHLEMRSLGLTRTRMLRARLRNAIATASLPQPGGELSGYAMATAQGSHTLVGPLIAATDDDACDLAGAIFHAVDGPVRIDVPGQQRLFREWLDDIGLSVRNVNTEMARGARRLPWQSPRRFALAAQAWG